MNSARTILKFIAVIFLAGCDFILSAQSTDKAFESGKSLFQTNCSSCHHVHHEVIGPTLASVNKKHSQEWLHAFIRNSQGVITSGDVYANQLFENYHHQVMPFFEELDDQQITEVLHYIEVESKVPDEGINADLVVLQQTNPDILRGHQLFSMQCASCHFIHYEAGYGPALGSVSKRHTKQWLHSFIHNSQKVIKSGDPYATALYHRFEDRVMVPMEFLKEDEIDAVLSYIEFASSSPAHIAGVNGRKNVLRSELTEIHGPPHPSKLKGRLFFMMLVSSLVIAGAGIYAFLIIKVFKYLNTEKPDQM